MRVLENCSTTQGMTKKKRLKKKAEAVDAISSDDSAELGHGGKFFC